MFKAAPIFLLNLVVFLSIFGCGNSQNQHKNYTVGIINLVSNLEPLITAFKKDMALRGYIEGSNITYLYNGALKSPAHIEQEVLSLVNSNVDLLVTMTTPATKKVKKILKEDSVPILFAPNFSPVSSGVVDSLAKPGGNVTGIKTRGSTGKSLEWFVRAVPSAKRIFVPFHHTENAAILTLEDLQSAATFLNRELVIKNLSTQNELETVLADIPDNIDAIWLSHSHLIISNTEKIIAAATARNIPVISSADQRQKGVLLCYAMSQEQIGKQASRVADKILKGAHPSTIPVETADFFLGLNLKTAKTIGITIPDDIISQADFITR